MNAQDAILKIKALFEDAPLQEEEQPEVKVEMKEYSLKDGTKVMVSSLEIGGEVKLEDGSFAPDAEHYLVDGTKVVTEGGKIVEIEAPAAEPDVEIEAGKDYEKKIEEMAAEFQAKIDALSTEKAALEAKVADIEAKAKQGFSEVVSLIEEMAKVPQADPIMQPNSFKFSSNNDMKLERISKYRNAILNNKN